MSHCASVVLLSTHILVCHLLLCLFHRMPCILYILSFRYCIFCRLVPSRKSLSFICLCFHTFSLGAPCGFQGCKNRPTPFSGRMSLKVTKSVCHIILACFILYCCEYPHERAPFCVLLVFVAMCSVFWLFWLSCQYLPSDWLERLL